MAEQMTLTPEQVADRLQVALRTVYSLLRSGQLHAVKVGRQWRVPVASLDEYLRGGRSEKEPS